MKTFKFIHTADIHLGNTQYKNPERYNDFNRSFKWILDRAIIEEVNFILLAGDLFNVKKINPHLMKDVFLFLNSFKLTCEAKFGKQIPIIAIEGNHDRPVWGSEGYSWMTFLTDLDLITVLNGKFDDDDKKFIFSDINSGSHLKGMVKIDDVHIYGLPYLGSITPKVIPTIYNSIEKEEGIFNILLLHYGITGYDTRKTGMALNPQLLALHKKIDYLALGHYHKMYILPQKNPWIYNPGSTELNSISEIMNYRGIFIVKVNGKARKDWIVENIICSNGDSDNNNEIPNRKFFSVPPIDIGQEDLSNFTKSIQYILNMIKKSGVEQKSMDDHINISNLNHPILIVKLKGEIQYSRMEINPKLLIEIIKENFDVLDVRVYADYVTSKLDTIDIKEKDQSIDMIEKTVLNQMISKNTEYSKFKNEINDFLSEYKAQLLKSGADHESIADHVDDWWIKHFKKNVEIPDTAEKEKNKPKYKKIDAFIEVDEDMSEIYDDGSAYLDEDEEDE